MSSVSVSPWCSLCEMDVDVDVDVDVLTQIRSRGTDVCITAHGGFINGFLTAVGRAHYSLPTGGTSHFLVFSAGRIDERRRA